MGAAGKTKATLNLTENSRSPLTNHDRSDGSRSGGEDDGFKAVSFWKMVSFIF